MGKHIARIAHRGRRASVVAAGLTSLVGLAVPVAGYAQAAKEKPLNQRARCVSIPGEDQGVQLGTDMLSDFSGGTNNGALLATTTIAKGYLRTWYKKYDPEKGNCGIANALSIDLSTTAALDTADFDDYARAELLGRRAGVVNLYFNPFGGRDVSNSIYGWSDRAVARDRIYMSGLTKTQDSFHRDNLRRGLAAAADAGEKERFVQGEKDTAWDRALLFYSFGIGGRGIKTAAEGSDIAAVGTIYAGIGFDGPFHSEMNGAESAKDSGGLSMELFATQNFTNRHTMQKLFAVDDVPRTYTTVGAAMKFWLSGSFFLSAEYNTGVGSSHRLIGDSTSLRFGYAKAQAPEPAEKATKAGVDAVAAGGVAEEPKETFRRVMEKANKPQ